MRDGRHCVARLFRATLRGGDATMLLKVFAVAAILLFIL